MTVLQSRTASLNKQQILIIKKALTEYINFNIGLHHPQSEEFKVIVNVLDSQLHDY